MHLLAFALDATIYSIQAILLDTIVTFSDGVLDGMSLYTCHIWWVVVDWAQACVRTLSSRQSHPQRRARVPFLLNGLGLADKFYDERAKYSGSKSVVNIV